MGKRVFNEDAAMTEAYLNGFSLQQVGAQFGCSEQTVQRALERTGTPRRSQWDRLRRKFADRDVHMQAMYLAGKTIDEIAAYFSNPEGPPQMSTGTVHRALLRTGTPRRPRSVLRLGDTERKCCACKQVKDLTAFTCQVHMPLGRSYVCRTCTAWISMRRTHGIGEQEFTALLDRQGGKCAICGSTFSKHPVQRLVIDHDHASGAIRGLLCSHCNRGIGLLGDNPMTCEAAARYLRAAALLGTPPRYQNA